MAETNSQTRFWSADFGVTFTDRNAFATVGEVDRAYENRCGVTRSQMNHDFLSGLDRNTRILEVGANMGSQLAVLQSQDFTNLYGIDVNEYAIQKSKECFKNLHIIHGDAFDIPFKDCFFELVFTSVLLIHIHPDRLPQALSEIYRVSRRYIWGYEFFAPSASEINYRGNDNVCWKMNYKKLYMDLFPGLRVVREKEYRYLQEANADQMFLLEKS